MKGRVKGGAARALKLGCVALLLTSGATRAGSVDVVTHHLDIQRTGWNARETALTWANVNASQFGPLLTVPLDEQVDAQPLVVSAASWGGGQPNDVAIVATENNTIYEIDSVSGRILNSRSLGTPVAMANLPGGCGNNSSVVGITSTPVLDIANGVMYVVAYTWEQNAPVYRLHKLNISTLADAQPPVVVAASLPLSDGSKVTFQAASQRQRAALLMSQGKIYAAFGAFCDLNSDRSRGWMFAFDAGTLRLVNDGIADRQTAAQAGSGLNLGWTVVFYLSSIWMSGYGPAADAAGAVFFTTGNSDASVVANKPDSVLKVPGSLNTVLDYFTPFNFADLDGGDFDFGSGGVMVVPAQADGRQFAAAAGKDGRMFLFNRKNLGGYVAGGPDVPPNVYVGACWCGPSYFVGSDGQPRIVSSGGLQARTWLLPPDTSSPPIAEATSPNLPDTPQDPGFHTFVSSNGRKAGTAIVWAVSRPANDTLSLYAFKGDGGLAQLYSAAAGTWVSSGNNANVFPVAAGGKVYVASYKSLTVFGKLNGAPPARIATPIVAVANTPSPAGGVRVFGIASSVSSTARSATLTLRDGTKLSVNLAPALATGQSVLPRNGEALKVEGTIAHNGVLDARNATRAKGKAAWGPDVR